MHTTLEQRSDQVQRLLHSFLSHQQSRGCLCVTPVTRTRPIAKPPEANLAPLRGYLLTLGQHSSSSHYSSSSDSSTPTAINLRTSAPYSGAWYSRAKRSNSEGRSCRPILRSSSLSASMYWA